MGFYSRVIFPRLCDWMMSAPEMAKLRSEVLTDVGGEVLEIGFGTGLNLAHYPSAVRRITTADLNPGMSRLARRRIADSGIAVDQRAANGEGLSFEGESFDCVASTWTLCSISEVGLALGEVYRVLRPGGSLLAGFMNPVHYLFDFPALERGEFRVAHRIPYSDLESLTGEERARLAEPDAPLEFGHTLEDQIGGQLAAGLVLTGPYEDIDPDKILGRHIPSYLATKAVKRRS